MSLTRVYEHSRLQALDVVEVAMIDKDNRNFRETSGRQLAEAERTIGQLAVANDPLGKASRRLP